MFTLDALLSSLTQPTFWHWFTAAVVFFILEIILPTTFLMWGGIGAFFTGLVVLIKPDLELPMQLVLVALFSVISTLIGRRWLRKRPISSDEPLLNRRMEQHIGRIVTLTEPITNGVGHLSIDDSRWKIEGPTVAAGSQVRITGVNGSTLIVELYIAG